MSVKIVMDYVQKIDTITLFVKHKKNAYHYYQSKFPFRRVGEQLKHGNIKFTLTDNYSATLTDHHVTDITFQVKNISYLFQKAIQAGAQALLEPTEMRERSKYWKEARVFIHNHLTHTFIEYEKDILLNCPKDDYLTDIDHITICVPEGDALAHWVEYYQKAYGFYPSYEEYVTTEKTGMNSKVVQSVNGNIKIVLVEPLKGKQISQVSDFIQHYRGPCVQHIAFSTKDIVATIKKLQQSGVQFLRIPNEYYLQQKQKLNCQDINYDVLQTYSILADRHENGFLYQAFTLPETHPCPCLFYEIIQRKACEGFTSGNIHALFKALEK